MTSQIQDLVKSEKLADAREQLSRVSHELEHVDRRARELIREHPVAALLTAAFVGHLVGRLVAATR